MSQNFQKSTTSLVVIPTHANLYESKSQQFNSAFSEHSSTSTTVTPELLSDDDIPMITNSIDDNINNIICTKLVQSSQSSAISQYPAILILDWDDTIMPTSYLGSLGYKIDGPDPTPELASILEVYSQIVLTTLIDAKRCSEVVIVTNAENGWIPLTVKKYLPSLVPIIETLKCISARSSYESPTCSTPSIWKEKAFRDVIDNHYIKALSPFIVRNIISIGDSGHEREAILNVGASMSAHLKKSSLVQSSSFIPQTRCKSLKFTERPDIVQLTKEHELICECLPQIINHQGSLDLCIQCTPSTGHTTLLN